MKIRDILFGICIIAYAIAAIVFILNYNFYLQKPPDYSWNGAGDFIQKSGYAGKPLVFRPGWLRNYATDHGRFRWQNGSCDRECPVFWLLSQDDNTPPKGYVEVKSTKVGNLWVMLMADESMENPPT
jgi:hypothetical protein